VIRAIVIAYLLVTFTEVIADKLGIDKIPALVFSFGSAGVILVAWLKLNPTPTLKEMAAENAKVSEYEHILAVSSPEEAKNKIGEFLLLVSNTEELQTKLEQSEKYVLQVETKLKQAQNSEEQNFASAKQKGFELDNLKTIYRQMADKLNKEVDKNQQLVNANEELVSDLRTYKQAIKDLQESRFGKLISEEDTEGFSNGYKNWLPEKKVLPKSIASLFEA
jgi:hypothetical protein